MQLARALTTGLLLAGGALPSAAADGRPNIVFVFSDDHAVQTLGATGSRLSEFCVRQKVTPNIDRLAAGGAVFLNSFCGNSLCSPSRAAILTGLHSHANGVMVLDRPLRQGLWTYPVGLRQAGYQSAVFGKWHLATTRPETDYWRILPGQGAYVDPSFEGPEGKEKHAGYASDIITDLALDWMKKRDPAKPFFLAVQHKAPHRNWIGPPRYNTWLDDVQVPEPDTLFDDYANRASPSKNQKLSIANDMTMAGDLKVGPRFAENPAYVARNAEFERLKPQGRDLVKWKYQQYMKDYLRCVKGVDDSVGRILEALQEAGLEERTVVIYSSDQGFYLGEHGWFDKRWIYEESIRMPLIVRWPGVVKPGSRPTAFVQNIDYAPTFVDLAGGKAPDGLHGRSFVPILRGETPADWRKSVYYHYYDPGHGVPRHCGVRTEQFTLALFYTTDEWELFDNAKDPNQLRSVFADPAYADTVTAMKAELETLRARFGDETRSAAPAEKRGGEARPRKPK
jgi:arylsulfatase A-like enzyme